MRLVILFFFTLILLSGCSNEKPKLKSWSLNNTIGWKPTNPPNFNYSMVLETYVNEIEKTKSPLISAQKLSGLVSFVINGKSKGDSINVYGSWNNHEGIEFVLYFGKGLNSNHLKTNLKDSEVPSNYFELGLDIFDTTSVVSLFKYNKANQLLDSIRFIKILTYPKDNDPSFPIQYIVNQKIISGNYIMTDDKGVKSNVAFNNDGTVTGFPNFKNYYISTDFLGGPIPTFDEIIFDVNLPTMKSYVLKKMLILLIYLPQ